MRAADACIPPAGTRTKSAEKGSTVIIADRNHHVRDFLKRELTSAGCHAGTAENFRQVIRRIFRPDAPDLLILDPDMPDADEPDVLKNLKKLPGRIPIVIHAFRPESKEKWKFFSPSAFVEKRGSSVENLKRVMAEILSRKP